MSTPPVSSNNQKPEFDADWLNTEIGRAVFPPPAKTRRTLILVAG